MEKKRKVLLFGGTFNPIHNGHLIIAQEAVEQLLFDEIIFIPSATPPHKKDVLSFCHRHKMTKLAVQDIDYFSVSDIESKLDGPSYTINTIRYFQDKLGKDIKIYWLIGDDTIPKLRTWYKIKELLQECHFLVAHRSEETLDSYENRGVFAFIDRQIKEAELIGLGDQIRDYFTILNNPIIEISSTDIRRRIKEKKEYATLFYMNGNQEKYIYDNQLYQD